MLRAKNRSLHFDVATRHGWAMNEARRLIVEFTEKQHGVVNRRQLNEKGLGSRALRHQVDSGFLVPLSPQVLRLAGSPVTEAQQAMAGVLDAPSAGYLSHRSAAAWWGLPGFKVKSPIEVVIPWQGTTRRTRLAHVHYHRALPAEHLISLSGIPVVSPALLIFLLAGTENSGRTERALDNGLSMRLLTTEGFHTLLAQLRASGRNGIKVARRLAADRPPGYVAPQSGLEARVERLAKDVDVQVRRQVDVGDDEGWIGRVDFEIVGNSDVIEVLSARYHSSHLDQVADAKRFARLEASGRRLLTIWDHDVWSSPDAVRLQILAFWRGGSTSGEQDSAPKREDWADDSWY
jgi:very-short-patch-repair endonuclease